MKDFFLRSNVVYYFREKSRGMTHNRSQKFFFQKIQISTTKTQKQENNYSQTKFQESLCGGVLFIKSFTLQT